MLLDVEMVEAGITRLCEARPSGRAHTGAVSVRCAHCGWTRYVDVQSAAYSKKAPPEGEAFLLYGGGGGNWTRVRQSSAEGSTCLVQSIKFSGLQPDRQGAQTAIPVSF